MLSSCFGGSSKKGSKSSKKVSDKKKSSKHVDPTVPIFSLEDIEEGVEGAGFDDEKSLLMSQMSLEKRFGQSAVFVVSTLMENGGVPQSTTPDNLLKEAIHVISCGYEDKTDWGSEIGWIYGSATEDILTGFKMHARGWRSIYCMPPRAAFKGSAPINFSDRLNLVLRWALGSVEILFSKGTQVECEAPVKDGNCNGIDTNDSFFSPRDVPDLDLIRVNKKRKATIVPDIICTEQHLA